MKKQNDTIPYQPASAPDYIPPEHLQALQLARLRQTVKRAWDRVLLYRHRLDERG